MRHSVGRTFFTRCTCFDERQTKQREKTGTQEWFMEFFEYYKTMEFKRNQGANGYDIIEKGPPKKKLNAPKNCRNKS